MAYSLTVESSDSEKPLGRVDIVRGILQETWPGIEGEGEQLELKLRNGQFSVSLSITGFFDSLFESLEKQASQQSDPTDPLLLRDDQIVTSFTVALPIGYPQLLVQLCELCSTQGFVIKDTHLDRVFKLDSPQGKDLLGLLEG